MQEIKCPKCGEVFQVDETGYAAIVKQVRDKEFMKDLSEREALHQHELKHVLELTEAKKDNEYKDILSGLNNEIERLKSKIEEFEHEKQILIQQISTENEIEIQKLQSQIDHFEQNKKLAIIEVETKKDKELFLSNEKIVQLKHQMINQEKENEIIRHSLTQSYEEKLKIKDEQIAYYKDFKAKQSTKMIGESLESTVNLNSISFVLQHFKTPILKKTMMHDLEAKAITSLENLTQMVRN